MNSPTHEEISHRAHQLWLEYGRPEGRDNEIWLSAEGQLQAKAAAHESAESDGTSAGTKHLEPAKEESPAGHRTEHHAAPTVPAVAAVQAQQQKKAARAPQVPHHTGPVSKPAETSKPLWN